MSGKDELLSTLRRSSKKAQDTWAATHDSAVEQYGEGERAHRTAFAALKHSFEKVGDRWERKEGGKKGPSDAQAARTGAPARRRNNETRKALTRRRRSTTCCIWPGDETCPVARG